MDGRTSALPPRSTSWASLGQRLADAVSAVDRRSDRTLALLVLVVGLVLALPGMALRADPNSDGLFYRVQVLELSGESKAQALRDVFPDSAAARAVAVQADGPGQVQRILSPTWERYTAQFFERRWTVPALALALREVTGLDVDRALQLVSMLGYALIGLALYGLLRRGASKPASLVGALACLCFPPLYRWSFGQFVDSWGVLLEVAGLLALVLCAQRGLRWLPAWVGAMVVLSLTRDATIVLGFAAVAVLLVGWRDPVARRRALVLVGTGAVAAVPALLLGGAPVRENLAYIIDGYQVPEDATWSFVSAHYLDLLRYTVEGDVRFPERYGVAGLALDAMLVVGVVAVLALVLRRPRGDVLWAAGQGAVVGCIVLLLLAANPQGFRLELVFVPCCAIGLAWLAERAAASVGQALPARSPAPA